MLDHLGIAVTDFARSRAFYEKALAPIGVRVVMEVSAEQSGDATHAGFGDTRPFFWISDGTTGSLAGIHVAFAVKDRALVDAFHAAALAAGGRDNGAPGLREHYHPDYYGAFVFDPDGHNVEVVCHLPAA